MGVTRIVANLQVADVPSANALYAGMFDLQIGMELGWVGNVGAVDRHDVQPQVITADATAPCNPAISVGAHR